MSEAGRQRLDDLPPSWRYVLIALKEVGFPVLVALGSLAILYKQMDVMKTSYDTNSAKVVNAVDRNTEAITALRHFLTHKYD